MNSIRELLQQNLDSNLSIGERARLSCQLAKQFERTGNYEAACRAMNNLWPGFGKRPKLDTLNDRTSAEVLLRVGVLTGWIGSTRLIKGSQQTAKELITESLGIFESLRDVKKVAEAQTEIALCYVREGALDVARILYAEALARLDDQDGDLKALVLLRSSIVELNADRLRDALRILESAVGLFQASTNHVLRGSFHNQFAAVLKNLGASETRTDYIDRVLNEYRAASFHFEQAGHVRYQACVENNLALLFLQVERLAEAHEHLDRAQALFTQLDDGTRLTRLEDARARVLLAEGKITKAEKVALAAVQRAEKGDEQSLLAEILTTHGIALARLHRCDQARATFKLATHIAQQAGDPERAGLAALALVEELIEYLSDDDLCSILERARGLLKGTQNTASLRRLTECAYRALSIIHTARPDWTTFSLNETLHRHEARFIRMALEESGGSVTRAAGLLGLPGHQTLSFILNHRHQQLLQMRTPVRPRRRRIFKVVSLK